MVETVNDADFLFTGSRVIHQQLDGRFDSESASVFAIDLDVTLNLSGQAFMPAFVFETLFELGDV